MHGAVDARTRASPTCAPRGSRCSRSRLLSDATPLAEVLWPARAAILLGAEGPGLSDAALATADVRVRIPMRPDVDSLNVATAAAVAFYEATRVQ